MIEYLYKKNKVLKNFDKSKEVIEAFNTLKSIIDCCDSDIAVKLSGFEDTIHSCFCTQQELAYREGIKDYINIPNEIAKDLGVSS